MSGGELEARVERSEDRLFYFEQELDKQKSINREQRLLNLVLLNAIVVLLLILGTLHYFGASANDSMRIHDGRCLQNVPAAIGDRGSRSSVH